MDDGRWVEGAGHVQAALEAIEANGMEDYSVSVLAFAEAARLALHRGDLDEVHRQLPRAMRARPTCTSAMPYVAVRVRLQLAKVHWALNDHVTAHHLLREVEDILLRRPELGALVDQVDEFRTWWHRVNEPAGLEAHPVTRRAPAPPVPPDAPLDP